MKHYVSEILPHLYLGDLNDANNHKLLQHLQISNVISLVDDDMEIRQMEGVKYHTFHVEDSEDEDISRIFGECSRIIKSSYNVLVHCRAGISRSPSIIIAHLMISEGMNMR